MRKKRDDIRNQIIAAAIEVFSQAKPWSSGKIKKIVEKANLSSTGQLYYYFNSSDVKLDILLTIRNQFWEKLFLLLEERLQEDKEPIDKVRIVLNALEETLQFDKRRDLAKVVGEVLPAINDVKDEKLRQDRIRAHEYNVRFVKLVDDILREGQEKGVFLKDLRPFEYRRIIYGGVQELFRSKAEGEEPEITKAWEVCINRLLINDHS